MRSRPRPIRRKRLQYLKRRAAVRLAVAVAIAGVLAAVAPLEAAAAERLDVNTASAEQLTMLPGIGEAKAAAIIEERTRMPFSSVADLERVKGIGSGLVADLRPHVMASDGKRPK